jgi:DNA-binding IclR family transcriptional regulator
VARVSELSGRQPKALTSALELLEAVAHAGPGVTAAELAAATGLPRATAYRLLNLLVADEFVVRLPDLTGFALGARVEGLVEAAAPVRVVSAVRDELDQLRAGVRAGVHLFQCRGGALRPADLDTEVPLPVDARRLLDRGGPLAQVVSGTDEAAAAFGGVDALAVAVRAPAGDLVAVLFATTPRAAAHPVGTYADRVRGTAKVLGPLLG